MTVLLLEQHKSILAEESEKSKQIDTSDDYIENVFTMNHKEKIEIKYIIHQAAAEGNFKIVRFLLDSLDKHIDLQKKLLYVKDNRWKTILFNAASHDYNYSAIGKYLIDKGIDVNANSGQYPNLHDALLDRECNKNRLVKFLIENGANVNIRDYKNRTLVHHAVSHDDIEMLKFLQFKADFSLEDTSGLTILEQSASEEAYMLLLESTNYPIDIKMVMAIKFQDLDSIRLYLKDDFLLKEILNKPTEFYGHIASVACEEGNMEIITLLSEKGCEFNIESEEYSSPIERACAASCDKFNIDQRIQVLNYLINEKSCAITAACLSNSSDCLEITKYLLDHGANPNLECDDATYKCH